MRFSRRLQLLFRGFATAALLFGVAFAQQFAGPTPLDASRGVAGAPQLERSLHTPLPEQYIWAAKAGDAAAAVDFRTTFTVESVPAAATLYIAAGQQVAAWLNGKPVQEMARTENGRAKPMVSMANVAALLRPGKNVLAIEVVRKPADSQARAAEAMLLAKIAPAAPYVDAKALAMSGPGWKTSVAATGAWRSGDYNDAAWQDADLLGAAESDKLIQWNRDANLNQWPGYDGISPYLAHMAIYPAAKPTMDAGVAAVGEHGIAADGGGAGGQSVVMDMGREVDGRLEVHSASPQAVSFTYQYGESMGELENRPYLGVEALTLPPNATAYGSKSAFRYVKLTFAPAAKDAAPIRLADVHVDGIYYPVAYTGSFETSDPELNRIWEVGAYTSHLCMQDGIWDAPKRDRGRWMGDLDVSGSVISHVFADHFLMEDTMDRLNPPDLVGHVNNIPGYSAFWVMGEADYYRAFASAKYLAAIQPSLKHLLAYMQGDLDERSMFANKYKKWPFVDWSEDLDKDTPESRKATDFEYYRAFRDGAFLLRAAGDDADAQHYDGLAAQMRASAEKYLKADDGTFGPRVQTNAMAIYSGIADAEETAKIEAAVLRPLGEGKLPKQDLSPYYSNYVLYAMAMAGDRAGALKFIRAYWGGMLAEGATSWWEGYSPLWEKADAHAHLKADDQTGYSTSLAHGWSSGPTTWLIDEVLGVAPMDAGYAKVRIRPDLGELGFARGAVPTPHGLLKVDFESDGSAKIEVPPGIIAEVLLPQKPGGKILVDGKQTKGRSAEDGSRATIELWAGSHSLAMR